VTPANASLGRGAESDSAQASPRRSLGPDVRLRQAPDPSRPGAAGLYVHIPFCLTRCGYCDFNTYAGLESLRSSYVSALLSEAELAAPEWSSVPFASIFLGGGTPTILPASQVVRLLDDFRRSFDVLDAEVTSEANPDTVDRAYLSSLREAGVTRVSMGAQSFDPLVLRALERIHQPSSVRAAFAAARTAGFDDVNLDLIYGAHGETIESWRRTLLEAVALGPEHVSAYALTIEPATPLGRAVAAGATPAPDSDLQAEMYENACELLGDAGYEHYEVSNWALPGRRCVHNLGYWQWRPYLGLGAGAHSYRDGRRWWNVRPPQQYIDTVRGGTLPIGGDEVLNDDERALERLLLGLRTADGVPSGWVIQAEADRIVAGGLAFRHNGHIALTDRGLLLANDLVLSLAR
jgi:putative oxygen-independent coproporphyrinogen III oxidase